MKTVYFNGNILTMEEPLYAEAVYVVDGIIRAVGEKQDVFDMADNHTVFEDLKGRTLMPAFLDSHSHITSFAQTMGLAKLTECASFDDIKRTLSAFREKIGRKNPLIGFGYDHNKLAEGRQPDRHLLDTISETQPILIANASGHMGAANSAMLKLLNITAGTPDPSGGKIGRDPDGSPNGYLEETAFTNSAANFGTPSLDERAKFIRYAENEYLKYGITTVQDGLTRPPEWKLLEYMSDCRLLRLDVVAYADVGICPELPAEKNGFRRYRNNLRMGGFKLFLDGSPQGKTAWMSEPYEGEEDYRGYPVHSDEEVEEAFRLAAAERRQILVHCNGDAACEQMIDCWERVAKETGADPDEIRPVMIHAQLLRRDQLPRMKQLGIIPSFFGAHVRHWGDVHLKNFGERAQGISPAKSAKREGIPFTLHQDTPVLPPDMLETVQCAVTRRTEAGIVLGEHERINALDALKAVTIHAAYQYFEENKKGSLRPGKAADFVVLERNPLTVPPETIASIKVLATIRRGEVLFRR